MVAEVIARVLVEEGGIIRCMFRASTVIFNKFVTKIFYKNTVGFTAKTVASTEEERIIRICILGAISILQFDSNQRNSRSITPRLPWQSGVFPL